MAFEDWDRNSDGSIKIHPVVGWEAFMPFGTSCGLRVHYVRSEAELQRAEHQFLPLVLNPAQARDLAQVLLGLADKAEAPAPPGTTHQ